MSFDPPPRPNILIEFGGNRTVPQGSPTVVWDLWFELFAKTALTTSGPGVTLTEGSVLFIDSGGNVTEDNDNFFWDDTNNRLGIGTNSPARDLTVDGIITAGNSTDGVTLFQDGGFGVVGGIDIVGTAFNALQLRAAASPSGVTILTDGTVGIGRVTTEGSGLTIDQGANDDIIASLKSSDVAHGITDIAETDTYGMFKKESATLGGLEMSGLAEIDGVGVRINAYADRTGS